MEAAGMKRFFMALVVFAMMILMTEATDAPAPSPISSDAVVTVPMCAGAAASLVMLVFAYL